MQEEYTRVQQNNPDDEIDLQELFSVLLDGKWIILSITTFVLIIGVIFSLFLPNIYISKALVVPVNQSNGTSGTLRSYNGLAGLAGISLPSSDDLSNSAKALQKINSLSFFENNILTNIYLPDLMAVKSWEPQTKMLVFDDNVFDMQTNKWIRDYSYPQKQIPSAQESFEVFKKEHLNIFEDINSGFITVSIKHQSPFIAKEWVDLVVREVNSFYRQKDKLEAEKAVNYLNKQISITGLSEIKEALAQLLQEETKKLTLIEANQSYVFDFIDPPAVMEQESEPNRILISLLSALLGVVLSIVFVLIRYYFFTKNNS